MCLWLTQTCFFFFCREVLFDLHKCCMAVCFVHEARVQQGLTAWAFKGVSLAGTKTQPLHHEGSDNLINVTIYSSHPSACLRRPDALLLASAILHKTTFQLWSFLLHLLCLCSLCSEISEKKHISYKRCICVCSCVKDIYLFTKYCKISYWLQDI